MKGINKQTVGFKFGNSRTQVLENCGEVVHDNRKYKLVRLKIESGEEYYSLRLYNGAGRFIKQFMFEPVLREALAGLIWPFLPSNISEALNSGDGVYRP